MSLPQQGLTPAATSGTVNGMDTTTSTTSRPPRTVKDIIARSIQRTQRIAAGYYHLHTPEGIYEVWREEADYRYGGGPSVTEWMATWPGETSPDAVFDTLADAKWAIANEIECRRQEREGEA